MSNYKLADTKTQWFATKFPGSKLNLTPETAVCVLHTTEGTGWPDYEGGATAPTYTARPNFKTQSLDFRAHFPDEMSARALRNEAGGVETNTLNCVQIELVGTCDPIHRATWNGAKAGVDYIFWPQAPKWALAALAAFLHDLHDRHGLVLKAPAFQAYPASAGARGDTNLVRMTLGQWREFVGICGHQHVPENTHGDPGNIDIAAVLALAAPTPVVPKPDPATLTRGPHVDAALEHIELALKDVPPSTPRRRRLETARDALESIEQQPVKP